MKRKYLFKSRKNMQYLKSAWNTRWKIFILISKIPLKESFRSWLNILFERFILTEGIRLSKKDQIKLLRKSIKEKK